MKNYDKLKSIGVQVLLSCTILAGSLTTVQAEPVTGSSNTQSLSQQYFRYNANNSADREELRRYQTLLKNLGFDPGPIDGLPGKRTTAAIKSFQKSRGLVADGILGPKTKAALRSASTGDPAANSGNELSKYQEMLEKLGFNPGPIDGLPGSQTTAAIKRFQRSRGLTADGILGPKTKEALRKAIEARENTQPPTTKPDPKPTPIPPTTTTPIETYSSFTYVAIGDSYAAGAGLKEERRGRGAYDNNSKCERHLSAYPARLAGHLESKHDHVEFSFMACSGAKINEARGQLAGASSELQRADAVTVMIGGNDLDWVGVIKKCITVWNKNPLAREGSCTHGREELTKRVFAVLRQLDSFYDEVIASVPQYTKIYVVGYPHLVPNPPKNNCYPYLASGISQGEREMLRTLADKFNTGMKNLVARKSQMTMIEMMPTFAGHESCTDDEWINAIRKRFWNSSQSYHPKVIGHRKMYEKARRRF